MLRVRITYTKSGGLRYTGNLDMHKIWERTMRRARLPLAYSQGFHPQPRINQASPLPLGMVSQVEMVDVATPYTTWRYTLNRQGAWGAWLMTPEIITRPIERKLPGLKNCYLAGQWVMCGGVPPSLYSGRHAVQLICRDVGRKFVTTV